MKESKLAIIGVTASMVFFFGPPAGVTAQQAQIWGVWTLDLERYAAPTDTGRGGPPPLPDNVPNEFTLRQEGGGIVFETVQRIRGRRENRSYTLFTDGRITSAAGLSDTTFFQAGWQGGTLVVQEQRVVRRRERTVTQTRTLSFTFVPNRNRLLLTITQISPRRGDPQRVVYKRKNEPRR